MSGTTEVDLGTVEAFAEKVLGDAAGAEASQMAWMGDHLGLFKDLAANGDATSDELAARLGLNERYVREWLRGMAAPGYLQFDPATGRFSLPREHAPVLAEEGGPWFFGALFQDTFSLTDEAKRALFEAFRTGTGLSQAIHGDEAAGIIDRFTAPWFEHMLVEEWLPAMPDVHALLKRGASVADVGCGQGRAVVRLAERFPASRFVGFDIFTPAIEAARARASEAGVEDRVRFEQQDVAAGLPDAYDIVTTFDVIHDSADPQGLLRAIHKALKPDGRYVCVDINCSDKPEENVGPIATLLYGASIRYCMSVSLAAGGTGLGTLGLPESKLRELATEAGFRSVRKAPIENPFNNVYELAP